MAQTISAQVVPNLTGEVFDVVGTSRTENYAFTSEAGLSNPVTTNWASSPGADVPLVNISTLYNIKSFPIRFDGYPTAVAKMARNLSVFRGTTAVASGLDYSKTWAVINRAGQTRFIRLDNNSELDPTSVDFHTQWNEWHSRFKGSFDAAGFPVAAFESSLTQFSILKRQDNATYTFTGFSPIITHTGEALARNFGQQTNNVVFYLKDTAGATDRFGRIGQSLFCRVEVELYNTERKVCDLGFDARAIEHIWFTGNKFYIMVLATNGDRYTFASAPYDTVIEERVGANMTPQSVLYSLVVVESTLAAETAVANMTPQSVLYSLVVVENTLSAETAVANMTPQSVLYSLVVVENTVATETAEANMTPNFVQYTYSPPVPPPTTPETSTSVVEPQSPDILRSQLSIQSLSFS